MYLVRISLGVEIEVVCWLTGNMTALLKATLYPGCAGEGAMGREAEGADRGERGGWVWLDDVLGQTSP